MPNSVILFLYSGVMENICILFNDIEREQKGLQSYCSMYLNYKLAFVGVKRNTGIKINSVDVDIMSYLFCE